jgi:AmiR/NasT family two-component response regulator
MGANADSPKGESASATMKGLGGESRRILVAEDDFNAYADIVRILQTIGYEVCGVARSQDECVALANELRPDLAIVSFYLGGAPLAGIKTARVIRRDYGTPIVYLAGFFHLQHLGTLTETEPYGFIMKPFNTVSVATTLYAAFTQIRREEGLRLRIESLEKRCGGGDEESLLEEES